MCLASGGGVNDSGGFIGAANAGVVQNVYALGSLTPTSTQEEGATYLGGLVGAYGTGVQLEHGYASVAIAVVTERQATHDFLDAFAAAAKTGYQVDTMIDAFGVKNVINVVKSARELIDNVVDVIMTFDATARASEIGGVVGFHQDGATQPATGYWDTELSGQQDYLWSALSYSNDQYGLSTAEITTGQMDLDWSIWKAGPPYTILLWQAETLPAEPTGDQ